MGWLFRLDYQPLFGKMSPHSSPERTTFIFDKGTFNTLEILSGKSETFPFNLVRSRESVSSDPQKTQPIFEDQRKLTTCRRVQKCNGEYFSQCMEKCTEKAISKVIWVGKGALTSFFFFTIKVNFKAPCKCCPTLAYKSSSNFFMSTKLKG